MADTVIPTNPWEYQAWAASQPGNTVNQWQKTPLDGVDAAGNIVIQNYLKQTGAWKPEWEAYFNKLGLDSTRSSGESSDGVYNTAGPAPDFSSLAGYSTGEARGPDRIRLTRVYGPDGKPMEGGDSAYEYGSMTGRDWAQMGALLGSVALPGLGYGAVATGAATGGLGGYAKTGTLEGALKGGVIGGALGGVGDYVSSAGTGQLPSDISGNWDATYSAPLDYVGQIDPSAVGSGITGLPIPTGVPATVNGGGISDFVGPSTVDSNLPEGELQSIDVVGKRLPTEATTATPNAVAITPVDPNYSHEGNNHPASENNPNYGNEGNRQPVDTKPPAKTGMDAFKEFLLKNPKLAIQLGAGLLGKLFGKDDPGSGGYVPGQGPQAGMTAVKPAAFKRQKIAPPPGYRPGIDPEHRYFTGIGSVGMGN